MPPHKNEAGSEDLIFETLSHSSHLRPGCLHIDAREKGYEEVHTRGQTCLTTTIRYVRLGGEQTALCNTVKSCCSKSPRSAQIGALCSVLSGAARSTHDVCVVRCEWLAVSYPGYDPFDDGPSNIPGGHTTEMTFSPSFVAFQACMYVVTAVLRNKLFGGCPVRLFKPKAVLEQLNTNEHSTSRTGPT